MEGAGECSTKIGARTEKLQEAYIPHWALAEHFWEGQRVSSWGCCFFKVLGIQPQPSTFTPNHPPLHLTLPCLQVPCPNLFDKHHSFQVSNQGPRKKQHFVLSWQLFQVKGWVKTHVGGQEGTAATWAQFSLRSGGGDQASIWPSWWLRLQFRPYFSKHSDKAFLNLKKDPRPSAKVGAHVGQVCWVQKYPRSRTISDAFRV